MKTIKSLFFILAWLTAVYGSFAMLTLYILPEVEKRSAGDNNFNWDAAKRKKEEEFLGNI